MSYYTAEGSKFYFSRTIAATKAISAITSADPAVATSTAHGYSDEAELLILSGWEELNEMVIRADNPAANTFEIKELDTTDGDMYPVGSGAGTAQLISNWLEVAQVLDVATSGGEPRYTPIDPLASRNGTQIATGFNPMSITLTMGWDPNNANYRSMLAASRRREKVALKILSQGGATEYGYGYLAVNEVPQRARGQVNRVTAAITIPRISTYA